MADEEKKKPSTWEKVGSGVGKAFSSAGPVIIVLALGGLGIYLLYNWLMQGFFGAGQTFQNLYQSQLDAYTKKMTQFSKDTNGNLSPAQMQAHQDEIATMKQTQANIANSYGNFNMIVDVFVATAVGLILLKCLPSVINKWKPIFSRSRQYQPEAAEAQIAMVDMMIADELAAEGLPTTATTFVTSVQNYYDSVVIPGMQTQLVNYQNMINSGVLTGFELLYAQYMVQAIPFDIAMLPIIWAMPFVP